MAWLAVITAGVLEVGFATMLKLSNNFTKTWPSIGFLIFASGSFSLLAWSLKVLPIGTAYAVWTGIGCSRNSYLRNGSLQGSSLYCADYGNRIYYCGSYSLELL